MALSNWNDPVSVPPSANVTPWNVHVIGPAIAAQGSSNPSIKTVKVFIVPVLLFTVHE
jgi:hypothetical protein